MVAIQKVKVRFTLHPGQTKAWESLKRFVLVLAGTQSGKALDIDTLIPTPRGLVCMGSLRVGEYVYDERGTICEILGASPVYHDHECYRVTFSDGASIVADAGHLWPVGGRERFLVSTTVRIAEFMERVQRDKVACPGGIKVGGDTRERRIVGADRVPTVPVRCIAVNSPNKLYVCGEARIPTHNTSFGPLWMRREIQDRGPGDYLVVTPTYPLLTKKALPEFLRLFKKRLQLGHYSPQQKIFTFSPQGAAKLFGDKFPNDDTPTQIFFGHAQDPDSLESATAKAAWLDEAGQKKFRVGSWEAILRRLSIHEGRVLLTTTPYDLGWLKQLLWDPWNEVKGKHPLIDVIRFDSTENPAFPRREFERARESMPAWRFDLFYRGIFTRPAGLIYSSFDGRCHKIPRIDIPPDWTRYIGLDFGGVNTAAIFLAEERVGSKPTGRLIAYREYKAGERTAAEHIYHLMKGDAKNAPEPRIPVCAGGSKSEGQWRNEFRQGGTVNGQHVPGLPIHGPGKPENEALVESGINRVFGAFSLNRLLVFDDLPGVLDELGSYGRELDEMGEPTEKIADKESYHHLDALRYIIGYLNPDRTTGTYTSPVARPGLQNL